MLEETKKSSEENEGIGSADESKDTDSLAEESEEKESDDSETTSEDSEETSEEETSEDSDSEEAAEKDEGIVTDKEDLSDYTKEEKPTGVDKRILKLISDKKRLESTVEKLEKKVDEIGSKDTKPERKRYGRGDLEKALTRALDNGDSGLVMDIIDHAVDNAKDDLRKEYFAEKEKANQTANQINQEWTTVVQYYNYLWDQGIPEVYSGSRKDLDLRNTNSLWNRLATEIYNNPNNPYRGKEGGQRGAVADALAKILKKKKGSSSGKEAKRLRKTLAKTKRKFSSKSGSSVKDEGAPLFRSDKEILADYIKDRKVAQRGASIV